MKMRIALWLSHRLPWTCWAALCAWAMGYGVGSLVDGLRDSEGCHKNDYPVGCWCGKFRKEQA